MSGSPTLPMGPRYVAACIADFEAMRDTTKPIEAAALVGFAWWWAREKGVKGWSKARLAHEEGQALVDVEERGKALETTPNDG